MTDNRVIEIESLEVGLPGISRAICESLIEACKICLRRNNHNEEIPLVVDYSESLNYKLVWKNNANEQIERSWKDQEVATEFGAICLSVLLALDLTDYTIIERSVKGTGFDYWLGHEEYPLGIFQKKARLEVSGIFKGDRKTVKKREREKLKQTNKSDETKLPAYISIIEFSEPYARFRRK